MPPRWSSRAGRWSGRTGYRPRQQRGRQPGGLFHQKPKATLSATQRQEPSGYGGAFAHCNIPLPYDASSSYEKPKQTNLTATYTNNWYDRQGAKLLLFIPANPCRVQEVFSSCVKRCSPAFASAHDVVHRPGILGRPYLTSSTNTQSPSPSWLLPGGVKLREPVLEKGDPSIAL